MNIVCTCVAEIEDMHNDSTTSIAELELIKKQLADERVKKIQVFLHSVL